MHLPAASDEKLLVGSYVVDEKAHKPQFLTETNQNKQATGVQGYTVGLLWKLLVQV